METNIRISYSLIFIELIIFNRANKLFGSIYKQINQTLTQEVARTTCEERLHALTPAFTETSLGMALQ